MNKEDIRIIRVTKEMLDKAHDDAMHLDKENAGSKTREGGELKNVKGSLAQQAVYQYLSSSPVLFNVLEYSDPYQKGLYGDSFDLKIFGETYDVKCRGCWNEKYWYNLDFMMGEHEHKEKVDNYIFTTVDSDLEHVYIIGGISYSDLWNRIEQPRNIQNLKFPTAGCIHIKHMKPLMKFILHA